jgi:triosephosphate isomerase
MKFFIGANLKMNKTYSELKKYNSELEKKYYKSENIELMIAPNFMSLNIFSKNKIFPYHLKICLLRIFELLLEKFRQKCF